MDEATIYEDQAGLRVTSRRISTAEGAWTLAADDRVDDRPRHPGLGPHLSPRICHGAGILFLLLGLISILWLVFGSGLSVWAPAVCLAPGFVLVWYGAESQGYSRRLMLVGKERSILVCRFARPWAKGWYGVEETERRYWELKKALEKALAGLERS